MKILDAILNTLLITVSVGVFGAVGFACWTVISKSNEHRHHATSTHK